MQEESDYVNEISLKEIILKFKEYIHELVKKWWLIAAICLISCLYFAKKHYEHNVTYTAKLKFVVEGQSGIGGGLGSLLGSFGIKKDGKLNPYKIQEVGRSSELLKRVLNTKVEDEILGNKILDAYNLNQIWGESNGDIRNFRFKNLNDDDLLTQGIFIRLRNMIWGSEDNNENAIIKFVYNEELGVYLIISNAKSEDLSINLTKRLYEEIKDFFEEKVFENQRQLTNILKAKSDSINNLIEYKITQLARFEDSNRGTVFKESSAKAAILSKEISALNIAYAELLKNYEMTDVNLRDIQPLFMAIDIPFAPLNENRSSLIFNLIIGIIIGTFISIFIIIFRKIYNEIME